MVLMQPNTLDKICLSNQKPRAQRRINGLQLPLHLQQIVGWLTIVITTTTNFTALVPAQCEQYRDAIWITFLVLYLCHATSHVTALLLDPAENKLRELSRFAVPEFDRGVHAHVIENGRCHLCNIETSDKSTKHCSICNKCVAGFDHHCKWLNHCIGKRNYVPFFASVTTATTITLFTTVICFCDVAFYFTIPNLVATENTATNKMVLRTAQNITNTTVLSEVSDTNWKFVASWTVYGLINLVISCVLLHLCTFHVYISLLGVSTYEYIVRNIDSEATEDETGPNTERINNTKARAKCMNFFSKRNKWHKNKIGIGVSTVSNEVVPNHMCKLELPNAPAIDMINKSNLSVTNLTAMLMSGINPRSETRLYQGNKKHQWNEKDITKHFMTDLPSNITEENCIDVN